MKKGQAINTIPLKNNILIQKQYKSMNSMK